MQAPSASNARFVPYAIGVHFGPLAPLEIPADQCEPPDAVSISELGKAGKSHTIIHHTGTCRFPLTPHTLSHTHTM